MSKRNYIPVNERILRKLIYIFINILKESVNVNINLFGSIENKSEHKTKMIEILSIVLKEWGDPIEVIQKLIMELAGTHLIIVNSAKSNFDALCMEIPENVFDLQTYIYTQCGNNKQPISLNKLVPHYLKILYKDEIIERAEYILKLYYVYRTDIANGINPPLNAFRNY